MLNHPDEQPSSLNLIGSLAVFLAYRDSAHARLGRTFCESLLSYLGCATHIAISEWTFGMLASSALREIAASEAGQARFVVLATENGGGLPEDVKAWFECWGSSRPQEQGPLVVLLSGHPGCAVSLWPDYGYLEAKTSTCGRRFVVIASGRHAENDGSFCLADARRVTSTGLVAVEGFHEVMELGCPGASQ